MNENAVLFGFFTVLLALLFQIFKSFLNPANAFLLATCLTVLIVFGGVGLREGINQDTTFSNFILNGQMRLRPRDLTVNPYTQSDLSVLYDFNSTKLDGKASGSIY